MDESVPAALHSECDRLLGSTDAVETRMNYDAAVDALIQCTGTPAGLFQLLHFRQRVAEGLKDDGPDGHTDLALLDAAIHNLFSHNVNKTP
jgi:hypothetical protein